MKYFDKINLKDLTQIIDSFVNRSTDQSLANELLTAGAKRNGKKKQKWPKVITIIKRRKYSYWLLNSASSHLKKEIILSSPAAEDKMNLVCLCIMYFIIFILMRENVRRVNQCLTNHLNIGLPAGVCKCIVMSGLCIDCLSPCVWRLTGWVLLRLELHRRPAYSKWFTSPPLDRQCVCDI